MNTRKIHDTLIASLAGELTFPQVVGALAEVGVESYRVDFVTALDTFYLADGRTHTEPIPSGPAGVAENFDDNQLTATIRGAQADTVRYPEFVTRCHTAGVAAYQVFITGRKAIYFGRKGETHVENFPSAKN